MRLLRLLTIVMPITIVKGLISGFQPYMQIILLKCGLPPIELAVKMTQYNAIFSVFTWLLLITFLLSLYFLYKPQNLPREYRKLLLSLFVLTLLGLFIGGTLGHIFGALYAVESPHVLVAISQALSTVLAFPPYLFGGFTVIALSYFIKIRGTFDGAKVADIA